jgi:hypothetical protein
MRGTLWSCLLKWEKLTHVLETILHWIKHGVRNDSFIQNQNHWSLGNFGMSGLLLKQKNCKQKNFFLCFSLVFFFFWSFCFFFVLGCHSEALKKPQLKGTLRKKKHNNPQVNKKRTSRKHNNLLGVFLF